MGTGLIRDIVDLCRVWESHADLDVRCASKPEPDPTYPTYAVSGSDGGIDDLRVAAVTTPQSAPDQLETLLRRLSTAAPAPAPKPEPPTVGQLLQCLLPEAQSRQPIPACDGIVSPAVRRVIVPPAVRHWMNLSRLCCRDGRRRRKGVVML